MAIKDRIVRTKPALPALGAAGYQFADLTFGSRMARLTDANTYAGSLNASSKTLASSSMIGWNSNATKIILVGRGSPQLFSFNSTSLTAAFIAQLNFIQDWTFSDTDPNILYGSSSNSSNHHTITRADVSGGTPTYTTLVNLDVPLPELIALGDTYIGNVVVRNGRLMFSCGGGSQDFMYRVGYFPLSDPTNLVSIDFHARTGFHMHNVQMDRTNRYALITPSNFEFPPYPGYIWDTQADTIYPVTPAGGGHTSTGYGTMINNDVLSGNYDAAQWIWRTLANPDTTGRQLISPLNTPVETFLADHDTWIQATPDGTGNIVSSLYRYYNGPNNVNPINNTPWRAWDDEIVSIRTDGVLFEVWRHCHHRTQVFPEVGTAPFEFWYTPRVNVSPDGKWAVFTSNWEKTLGDDPYDGTKRVDVFLVELTLDNTHRRHGRFHR